MVQAYDIPSTYIYDYFDRHSFLPAVTLRLFFRVLHRIGCTSSTSVSDIIPDLSPVHTDCTNPREPHTPRFGASGLGPSTYRLHKVTPQLRL